MLERVKGQAPLHFRGFVTEPARHPTVRSFMNRNRQQYRH
jgi:hypothetical protein